MTEPDLVVVPLDATNPVHAHTILMYVRAYLRKMRLPENSPTLGANWTGIFSKQANRIVLVMGWTRQDDGATRVTEDFRPMLPKLLERTIANFRADYAQHGSLLFGDMGAALLAMRLAVQQLNLAPDYLLIDGVDQIDWPCPQQSVIQGDSRSLSIAAASVLAKVHRDRLLVELDSQYPGYGLASHKGYCCPQHFAALARLGPTPLHRRSFRPIAQTALQFPELQY